MTLGAAPERTGTITTRERRADRGLRRGRAPEELELDFVRIAEGEHRVRGVRRVLDPRMRYAELVEPLGPLVEIGARRHQESR